MNIYVPESFEASETKNLSSGMHEFMLQEQTFVLHPYKGIYWKEEKALLIADLHLGKASHFRKAGIPVPQEVQQSNFDKFMALLLDLKPEKVLILGDLFHSDLNNCWEDFIHLTKQFEHITFDLVIGNHDILALKKYQEANLNLFEEGRIIRPFILTHHPLEEVPENLFNLCGHVHPSVRLSGKGRQTLRLPCFYFGKQQGILPAFGEFTGTYTIKPNKEDKVFVIAEEQVIAV